MAVYPFVSLGWLGYLVKPRFDVQDGQLVVVNSPIATPNEIVQATAPKYLPYIEYDPGYVSQDWTWRFDKGPLFLRLFTSILPRWPNESPAGNADAETLNASLLRALVDAINADGATPLLVYLPSITGDDDLAYATLERSRLPYHDMSECVARVPETARRVASGNHFTGIANLAIAECTAAAVSLMRSSRQAFEPRPKR
jgi:hypothetical protein